MKKDSQFAKETTTVVCLVTSLYCLIINYFIDKIISVLEPITVTYSNKLLADQIYFISIVLFIMSILVTGLILFLFLNIVIFTFSDKLLNLFTNKYVR